MFVPSPLSHCPLLKLPTQMTNFLEAWYKHNTIRSYRNVVLFNFLVNDITTEANYKTGA